MAAVVLVVQVVAYHEAGAARFYNQAAYFVELGSTASV